MTNASMAMRPMWLHRSWSYRAPPWVRAATVRLPTTYLTHKRSMDKGIGHGGCPPTAPADIIDQRPGDFNAPPETHLARCASRELGMTTSMTCMMTCPAMMGEIRHPPTKAPQTYSSTRRVAATATSRRHAHGQHYGRRHGHGHGRTGNHQTCHDPQASRRYRCHGGHQQKPSGSDHNRRSKFSMRHAARRACRPRESLAYASPAKQHDSKRIGRAAGQH